MRDSAGIPLLEHYDPVAAVISMDNVNVSDTVCINGDFSAHADSTGNLLVEAVCPSCSSDILYSDDCFECDSCSNWLHIACLNISKEVYDAINVMNEANELKGAVGDCLKIICTDCQLVPTMPTAGVSGLTPHDHPETELSDSEAATDNTPFRYD